MVESNRLQRALEMARRSLAILEEQASNVAPTKRLKLQEQIEEKRREIAEMEERLEAVDVEQPTPDIAFDQIGQVVGSQTNIAGDVHGPVLSGQFDGPVAVDDSEATDLRGLQGVMYKQDEVVDVLQLRAHLLHLDSVEIEALCLDHFPIVFDGFSRGMRRDEMINLLLNYCRRNLDAAKRLRALLKRQ